MNSKKPYIQQLHESFFKEFNIAKKRWEAENKQAKAIKNCASEIIPDFTVCIN